jgi:SAM-dependent methyltransferase
MSDLEKIASIYDERVKKFGYGAQSVGWASKDQQILRFRVLTENVKLLGKTVIDIGCGFGDFYEFLCESDSRPLQYVGIDISDELLKVAHEKHLGELGVTFHKRQLMFATDETYDFAVASGSLNYRLPEDMYDYLEKFVKTYEPRIREGLLLNLLSTKVDYMQEIHAHYSPVRVEAIFLKYFGKVRVIEEYGLYEFTIQALR